MATPRNKRSNRRTTDRLDEGDWLYPLLAEAKQQVTRPPRPQAIGRIRRRLLAEIDAPTQAAA